MLLTANNPIKSGLTLLLIKSNPIKIELTFPLSDDNPIKSGLIFLSMHAKNKQIGGKSGLL